MREAPGLVIKYRKGGGGLKLVKILLIATLLGAATGCPKRQTNLRLAYVPAPPAASVPSGSPSQVMVIESPPPPKPVESVPAPATVEAVAPEPAPAPVRHVARDRSAESAPVAEPTTDAPPLEPLQSPQQQTALAKQVEGLENGVESRIQQLSHASLSVADRKALDDARAFLSQADQAMKKGDLQESMNLTQKADLLVAAIEKRQ
ncbi:MAG: hypothetical protein ACRD22_20420 [Terriglobia bacterium]